MACGAVPGARPGCRPRCRTKSRFPSCRRRPGRANHVHVALPGHVRQSGAIPAPPGTRSREPRPHRACGHVRQTGAPPAPPAAAIPGARAKQSTSVRLAARRQLHGHAIRARAARPGTCANTPCSGARRRHAERFWACGPRHARLSTAVGAAGGPVARTACASRVPAACASSACIRPVRGADDIAAAMVRRVVNVERKRQQTSRPGAHIERWPVRKRSAQSRPESGAVSHPDKVIVNAP
jgi:hypothetical protein